jgi:DNA-binding GntR family transcriptional regulator
LEERNWKMLGSIYEDLSNSLTLRDKVYSIVKTNIINGTLKPGTHLNEQEMSKAMRISRGPIREALNMLEKEGFTVMIPRKGRVVAGIEKEDVKNLCEMRRLLEPYAAKASVNMVTDNEIIAIEQMLIEVLNNPEDFNAYMNSDLEVHGILCKHLSNNLLKNNLTMLKQHSLRIRYLAEDNTPMRSNVIRTVTREHLDIIEALKKRDANAVLHMVNEHLKNTERRTLGVLDGGF